MRKERQGWQAIWRGVRIMAMPAGLGVYVLAQLYGGMVDGVVMSCSGIGKHAHCRWASIVQEPLYVQSVIDSWWCLLAICAVCCYITYCRAFAQSESRRQ